VTRRGPPPTCDGSPVHISGDKSHVSLLPGATPRSRRTRAVLAVPAIALAAASLAACGGGSSGGASAAAASTTSSGPATSGGASGFQAYLACLKSHGVAVPTGRPAGGFGGGARPSGAPRGNGGGGGFGALTSTTGPNAAAVKACASLRPTGGFGGGGVGNSAALQSQLTAYRSCLSDHGVTLPTQAARPTGQPAAGAAGAPGGRRGFGGLGALNTADPKTAAAVKACAALRPSFGGGRTGGGTGAAAAPSATPNT
jgi:hypothetical protein